MRRLGLGWVGWFGVGKGVGRLEFKVSLSDRDARPTWPDMNLRMSNKSGSGVDAMFLFGPISTAWWYQVIKETQ